MNREDIHIRCAEQEDLDRILNLYTHLHDNDINAERKRYEKKFYEIISFPSSFLFLLENSETLIASCILFILPNLTRGANSFGIIENVVTRREFRGKGYGTGIITHALQVAWSEDCYKVMLLTGRSDERVRKFYENAGFIRGIKEGFIAYPPKK